MTRQALQKMLKGVPSTAMKKNNNCHENMQKYKSHERKTEKNQHCTVNHQTV